MKNSVLSSSQIREIEHLHFIRRFDSVSVARTTGVSLWDVFRITGLPEWLKLSPDGTVLAGQHRLLAMLQASQ